MLTETLTHKREADGGGQAGNAPAPPAQRRKPQAQNGAPSAPRSPVVRELPGDLETPASVYLKLAGRGPSFLLESVTGGEQVARYSFIGVNPSHAFVFHKGAVECHSACGISTQRLGGGLGPSDVLRAALRGSATAPAAPAATPLTGLPRFAGGLVGYLSYEMARYFEPSLSPVSHPDLPEAIFLLADTLVAFDHARGRMLLIATTGPDGDRAEAEARLDVLEERLALPLPPHVVPARVPSRNGAGGGPRANGASAARPHIGSNKTLQEFADAVLGAKEHIAAGDIFQVVLSQRFSRSTSADAFSIYRALRRLNPSPYMFFFDFADLVPGPPLRLIGASPEMHVRLEGRRAAIRPIAGTRPRGSDPASDALLEQELLADPKERAEHVMLVDLARNDLGRVCSYGTVHSPELMSV